MKKIEKKLKNIGILTFHFSNHNYGAVLQTFASYSIIKKLGYTPQIINLVPDTNENIIVKIKTLFISILKGSYKFKTFIKNNMYLTKKIYPNQDLKFLNYHFDGYYVGSDQVWRPSMAKDNLLHYFLDFSEDNKLKIAYATSFGLSKWECTDEITKKIKILINRFNAVFVREKSGIDICREIFNVNAKLVLDPTLLMKDTDYYPIMNIKNKFPEKYIGIYLLDDRKCNGKLFNKIKKCTNIRCINLYGELINIFGKKIMRYRDVGEWLAGIKNASFIITDSYHCVLFSIIFRKNFICYANVKRGITRLINILSMLGIKDRLCETTNEDFKYYFSYNIDYDTVYTKLNILRKRSLNLLDNAITLYEKYKI